MATDEIRALVAQLEADLATTRERATARAASSFVEQIQPNLGSVTVRGTGELAAVDLDTSAVKRSTGRALAAAVLDAIKRAEQQITREGE